jgi:hypothetical protein
MKFPIIVSSPSLVWIVSYIYRRRDAFWKRLLSEAESAPQDMAVQVELIDLAKPAAVLGDDNGVGWTSAAPLARQSTNASFRWDRPTQCRLAKKESGSAWFSIPKPKPVDPT